MACRHTLGVLASVALALLTRPTGAAEVPPASASPPVLTGWGGGAADTIVPQAAAIGFSELVLHHEDSRNFTRAIALGQTHGVDIYAWVYLGDLPAWKQAFPEAEPPWQVMAPREQEAFTRLTADRTPGKAGYQFGGEPHLDLEVLLTPLLCFHDPRVLVAFQRQIEEILAIPGVRGLGLDYLGYQNYRCCHCPTSLARLADYRRQHPEEPPELALERFSLASLVEFNNALTAHARTCRPTTRVLTHVYPVYLPEPLYGNRLDVDVCGQTAAWFFEPFWSLEKIGAYARIIAQEAARYHPHAEGAALIGYYNQPGRYPVKSPERLRQELDAVLGAGCRRVQVCSFGDLLKTPDAAAVFRARFARPAP